MLYLLLRYLVEFIKDFHMRKLSFRISVYLLVIIILCLAAPLLPAADQDDQELEVVHSKTKQKIIQAIRSRVPNEVTVFIISMLPIFELRGSIPVGIAGFKLNPALVYILSVIGNIIPAFFILLFFGQFTKFAQKVPILKRFLDWLFARTRQRSAVIEKYEELGLILFVAIPLPVTGAWTGSLAAFLLGLRFWKSMACILMGVCLAGVVVTVLSLMGMKGLILAVAILFIFALIKFINIRESVSER